MERGKKLLRILALLVCVGLCGACADKGVPEAPGEQTATTQNNTQTTEQNTQNAQSSSNGAAQIPGRGEYFGWGAHVGTTDILKRLADCNQRGFFFAREANGGAGACDENMTILGQTPCNNWDNVKQVTQMTPSQIEETEWHMGPGQALDGFSFDQCKDGAVIGVVMVKEMPDGSLRVSSLNVDKPL